MDLKVKSIPEKLEGTVNAPASKSYSHRAIMIAALAEGESKLYNVLLSEDVLSSINACEKLGAVIIINDDFILVKGTNGKIHNSSNEFINLGNSGTTLRLITSISALSDNRVLLSGDSSLRTRPMGELINTLNELGVNASALKYNDKAPLKIEPGYTGGIATIKGDVSSQFISSLLISAPLSDKGLYLNVLRDFVSKPYVDMTIDVMNKFGIQVAKVENDASGNVDTAFIVQPSTYTACDYIVEGDFSSASYLLAACAIGGGEIRVDNLFENSKQGDKIFLDILEKMGCTVEWSYKHVVIKSDGNLTGVEVDLTNSPDLICTVAALAACASGETKITGVAHARFKETDRIKTCCEALKNLNCDVEEFDDGMIIKGGFESGTVDSYNDHRLAMAFSLLGLKEDVRVSNGEVFNISFPNFISSMSQIGLELELD